MTFRGRLRGCSGQDLVEYALIVPLLLTLTFVLIEMGGVVFQYNVVANAAREGARRGIVTSGNDAAVISAATAGATVRALAGGLDSSRLTVTATTSSGSGRRIQVVVLYQVHFITVPVIQTVGSGSAGPFTLRAASSMLRE